MYDTLLSLIFAGMVATLFAVFRLNSQVDRVAAKLDGSEDWKHDDLIDEQVSRELESYLKRRQQLEAEKQEHQEVELSEEKLRRMIVEACGSPGNFYIDEDAQKVTIDSTLAYHLEAFAYLAEELSLREIEWLIQKIQILGSMRKRAIRLATVASDEFELRRLEREMEEVRTQLQTPRKAVWDSFRKARDKNGKGI